MPPLTYAIDAPRLGAYADRFVRLDADRDTLAFVETERRRPHSRGRWAARALVRVAVSGFSANALLDTYPLFMLSEHQWRRLLAPHAQGRLLDVGAAAGHVTSKLAPLFDDVTATDVSRPMVRRLRARGLRASVMDLSDGPPPDLLDHGPYDTVALLNVLDRCARPRTMLRAALDVLAPGGTLVVAMPLPYDPCWYDGPRTCDPVERLPLRAREWEAAAEEFARHLEDHGGRVVAITRAPYLSGGDRREPLYVLDAVIVVLAYK
jgi:2-polyprenyl-3-methyl-5-hydroxy-6-metoxy-1,4-benzoquinol methylase